MSKNNKQENGQTLESILFNCRNALRGAGGTEKNRDAVIGLVFIKFAGDKFEKRRKELKEEYGDIPAFLEKKSFYLAKNVFYLQEHCRWSYIVKEANSNDIAVKLDTAMADIEKDNPPLQGALLSNFYSSLGADIRTLKNLIDEINKINEERFQEEDLIGRVYEYFLQSYAVASTKEEGEFYTPACLVELIAELIEPYSGSVYDPCCGSGGMFVQSMKFVERHHGNKLKVSIVGQEKNPDTRRLAKMNLAIRGIAYDLGEKAVGESSTFTDDQHLNRKVDYIMANPPFNLKDWRGDNELLTDPRWHGYETPPKSNANYAWILHMLSKLDVTNGVAGFLLANGALNSDGVEYEIRKKLIENDKIEAIIVLPRDMFYTTDISVTLWIINNNKKARTLNNRQVKDRTNEILFVDLRTWDENIAEYDISKRSKKRKTVLTDEQIDRIKNLYFSWQTSQGYDDIPELCKSASLKEIREANYSLAPSKYVEFIDRDLDIDYEKEMVRIQTEMKYIMKLEKESQKSLEDAFRGLDMKYSRLKIGEFIKLCNYTNTEDYNLPIYGINKNKEFMPTVANTSNVDKKKYKIMTNGRFIFSGMQTGRDQCIRIGLYERESDVLVSPAYTTFEVDKKKILPEYLFMIFKSSEKDRYGAFLSDGSIRANLDWEVFCGIEIIVPSIEIQKKYVAVYKSMLKNQEVYEKGLEDLKLVCDTTIEKLRGEMPSKKIKDYIQPLDGRNNKELYDISNVKGLSIQKEFIETKANLSGVSLTSYKVVKPESFAYVTVTSRNSDRITMAYNRTEDTYIVSSSYIVFNIAKPELLNPEYLFMFFERSEFDRYTRFHSWGSARETFMWDDLVEVEIPIPDIKVQNSIVDIYNAYITRMEINEQLKGQINDICPVLIKGSLEEVVKGETV